MSGPGEPPPVTFAVINYEGADVLPATLGSIQDSRAPDDQILLVDDGSEDGSPEWAEAHCPGVEVLRMGRNTGRLNRLRSLALRRADRPLVFLTDNDVVVRPGCVNRLREVLLAEPGAVCCTPRLVRRSDPGIIHHDGGGLHYLCVSTAVPRGEPAAKHPPGPPRPTVGGGIMLLDRERALSVGGFDERCLLGWGDDGEFHFRCRISGYRVLQVSDAVCEHVSRREGERRVLGQLYNRYRLLAAGYSARALLLLSPALVTFEVALTVFAALGGFLRDRFRALGLALRDRRQLGRRRRRVQALRRRPDSAVLDAGPLMTPPGQRAGGLFTGLLAAGTALLDLYWALVRRWV